MLLEEKPGYQRNGRARSEFNLIFRRQEYDFDLNL